MRYLAILHQDRPDGPFGVTVPDLPGCFSAGDTLAEALENTQEAIALHIEGMLLDGDPVPPPAPTVDADGGIVAAANVDDGLPVGTGGAARHHATAAHSGAARQGSPACGHDPLRALDAARNGAPGARARTHRSAA